MFLNGAFLGISFLQDVQNVFTPVQYNRIEIFGGCTVDKVRALNINLTPQEVNNLRFDDEYTWNPNTLLYAEFNNTLDAGNIRGITNPITSWEIYRKEADETVFNLLTEVDVDIASYIDYTARSFKSYDYRVFALNDSEISTPLDADTVDTNWYFWALIDPDDGTVYLFDLDVNSGGINRNQDVNYYDTSFARYTPRTYGQQDYITGSISATGGECSNTGDMLDYPRDYLDRLGAFINNKKNKILKNRFGEAWVVSTDDFNYQFNDPIARQISTINFTFRQVADL